MEWAKFTARSWCDWVKANIGDDAFGDGSFVYDIKRPGFMPNHVPVFNKMVVIIGENEREVNLTVRDVVPGKKEGVVNLTFHDNPEMNWKIFMCVRDTYHLATPLNQRPDDKFEVPVESTKTLSYLTYINSLFDERSLALPFLRVGIRPAVYASLGRRGEYFDELNMVSLRTITGVLCKLRQNAQTA